MKPCIVKPFVARFCILVPMLALIVPLQGISALAQSAAPGSVASKPVDAKLAAAQAAFEALPEAERRAIQNDLVWATDYFGAALGTFGKLTFDGITGVQKQVKGRQDGILDPDQRKALALMAQKKRDAAGFKLVVDANTGSRIGTTTLLPLKQEKTAQGTKWSSGTDFVLETVKTAPDHADLAGTFERFVAANVAGRKVTYKLLRWDFFVVSGEINGLKFYTRFAPTQQGLRGYTLTYNPKISPDADRFAIAVANTFEPLAGANTQVEAATAVVVAGIAAAQAGISTDMPTSPSSPSPSPVSSPRTASALASGLKTSGTALLIGKGLALVPKALADDCPNMKVGGLASGGEKAEIAPGLALVKGPNSAVAAKVSAVSGAVAVFGFSNDKIQASAGEISAKGDGLLAPLQAGQWGALVLGPEGQIAGLVLDDPAAKPKIGAITLNASYHLAGAEVISAALVAAKASFSAPGGEPPRTTGESAQIAATLLAAVSCGP